MPIINSVILSSAVQADGRSYVTERHTDQNGKTYDYTYLADIGMDTALVMSLRAANLGAEIDARAAAEAAALGFVIPLTKYQFRQRFTAAERMACDAFNISFESNASLTADQKAQIRTGLADFSAAEAIDPALTLPLLQLYEALGLIGAGRAAIIGAP